MSEALDTFHPPLNVAARSRLKELLLGVKTIHGRGFFPRCGAAQIVMGCHDGSRLVVTTNMLENFEDERLEVGCVQIVHDHSGAPVPNNLVLLGGIPESIEVGLLEIEVEGRRIASGVFFQSSEGETGIVACVYQHHLAWYGIGLKEPDGEPEYDLKEYRQDTL